MKDLDKIVMSMKEEINKQADAQVESILKDVEEIRAKAEAKVKEDAQKEADLHLAAAKRKLNSEKAQLISTYNSEKTKALIHRREYYMQQLFEEAKQQLLEFCASNGYLEKMEKRLEQYVGDEHVQVYVKKEDTQLIKMIKEKLDCDVIAADIEIGGFRIENAHHQIIDETLDAAFKDQRIWFEDHSKMFLQ